MRMTEQPNIILVMCDDLGFGDVGFNGGPTIQTPCLDKLAGEGIRFERYYAGGPVCSPTRGTCLTGRHYTRYGINHANQGRLPTQEITLATLCKEQGYATGHFGKWHLGTLTTEEGDGNRGGSDPRLFSPPWVHDFDRCFSTESKVPTWDPMRTPDEQGPRGPRWGEPGTPFGTHYWNEQGEQVQDNLEGCDSARILDRAELFIRESVEAEKPFFSVIWFHAPHTPVVAGPEWRALYPEATEDEQHYYGCVSAMDAQMGRLDELLEKLGQAENTLLWFCSDNGPEGGGEIREGNRNQGSTGGLRGRKRSLYDGGVGVPALCRWPARFSQPQTVTAPCSTLDLLPSCCAAMGIDVPWGRPIDGIDILPMMEDPVIPRPRPIPYRFLEQKSNMFDAPTFALMDNRWKFLSNLDPEEAHDQLYDMESDREERHNLIAAYPDLQKKYRNHLERFMASCRSSHSGADYEEEVDMVTAFQETRGWRD